MRLPIAGSDAENFFKHGQSPLPLLLFQQNEGEMVARLLILGMCLELGRKLFFSRRQVPAIESDHSQIEMRLRGVRIERQGVVKLGLRIPDVALGVSGLTKKEVKFRKTGMRLEQLLEDSFGFLSSAGSDKAGAKSQQKLRIVGILSPRLFEIRQGLGKISVLKLS